MDAARHPAMVAFLQSVYAPYSVNISDVAAVARAPSSRPAPLGTLRPPRLFLVARAYAGDKVNFDKCIGITIDAFVDWRTTHLSILLDSESAADRAWGETLTARFAGRPVDIVYVEPPPKSIHELKAFSGGKYGTPGYHRQLWDTFHFDLYLPNGAAAHDVVGVFDMDAPLMTVIPPATVIVRPGGVLRQQCKKGDGYVLGGPLLQGNFSATNLVSMMDAGYMPQFFFVRTFAQVRAHIAAAWKTESFEQALVHAVAAGAARPGGAEKTTFSPVNVMLNFALRFDPAAYEVAPYGTDGPGALAFGYNMVCGLPKPWIFRRGCCRTFNFSDCTQAERSDPFHITMAADDHDRPYPVPEMQRVADAHYAGVVAQVASMDPLEAARMRAACALHGGLTP